jgi:hypothetical protein
MDKLIVHSSVTSAWHSLVTHACQVRSITLSEDIESYLVYLLMRFSNSPDLLSKIMATEVLNAAHLGKNARLEQLKEIGDSCLLYSGFFPGLARKRRVSISYYVNIGRNAYSWLYEQHNMRQSAELYRKLEQEFVCLMDLLLAIREMDGRSCLDPLQAVESSKIGSQYALESLSKHTSVNPTIWQLSNGSDIKH